MTSISKRKTSAFFAITFAFVLILSVPQITSAQRSVAISVTPTLFEMAASPGQLWNSSVKVINSNSFPLTVYVQAVNFAPEGEEGQGKLLPVFETVTEGSTLAEWITVSPDPVTIPSEQSIEVPFTVSVPDNAAPGGHFAAILISTQPPASENNKLVIQTSQIVSSLFFVRIAGDVIESGDIRSFVTTDSFSQSPEATFELRFENKGNVHLQPRGEITIYNMWGAERGKIPINHKTHFGNVLPESIRKFEFSWMGESSLSEIGRYTAEASLGYGFGDKKFANASTHFWVIPLKGMFITLGSLLAFILFVTWAIKLYVRRVLQLSGVSMVAERRVQTVQKSTSRSEAVPELTMRTVSAPVREGYQDLRERLSSVTAIFDVVKVLAIFVRLNWIFFTSLVVIIISVLGVYWYVSDATESEKSFDVAITNPEVSLTLSSEEILYEDEATARGLSALAAESDQVFTIDVVNTSGDAGAGAKAALALAADGYVIQSITTNRERLDKRTVIVFDATQQEMALAISRLLGEALLSARSEEVTEANNITIFVGQDQSQE